MFSLEIGSVIHQTQIERGTTALYVSSNGDPFLIPRLEKLYGLTDTSITSLTKWIPLNHDHFGSRDQYHAAIRDFRSNLDPQNATLRTVVGFYTRDNRVFIEMIGKSINVDKSVPYWTSLVAYQMLIMSKEQAGIERALGSTYYARGNDVVGITILLLLLLLLLLVVVVVVVEVVVVLLLSLLLLLFMIAFRL